MVARHPGIVARQRGLAGLCQTCQECPVVTSCGGGLYAHRYRAGTEFANPSVYCADLLKLITHIKQRLPDVMADRQTHEPHHERPRFPRPGDRVRRSGRRRQAHQSAGKLRRALVAAVYQAGSATAAVRDTVRQALRDAWTVLAAVDQSQPGVLNEVLGDPYVRVWAVRCLEQLRRWRRDGAGAGLRRPGRPWVLGRAAAALRSGRCRHRQGDRPGAGRRGVPACPRPLGLPGLKLRPKPATLTAAAIVVVDGGAVDIQVGDHSWTLDIASLENRSPHWEPVRKLQAPGICVAVEDTDPYRDCHQWPAAPRLSDAEFARWDQSLPGRLADDPGGSRGVRPGPGRLTVLMPLQPGPEGGTSARPPGRRSVPWAYRGPIRRPGPAAHCTSSSTSSWALSSTSTICSIATPGSTTPRAEDLRPFEGLLQGTYAHLAVSEFWRSQAETGTVAAEASQRYQPGTPHPGCDRDAGRFGFADAPRRSVR